MWFSWVMLVVGLIVILVGCDIFTNSIEWLGKKLDLNEGLLGSIFAAVGTALPETLIPIVAVIIGLASGGDNSHANDVGLGAIIGAPFMLATVAMIVTGIAIYIFKAQKRRDLTMHVNSRILSRDIPFLSSRICRCHWYELHCKRTRPRYGCHRAHCILHLLRVQARYGQNRIARF